MKKVLAMVLALILCLGILAGCEQKPAETSKPAETTKPAETKPTEGNQTADSTEPTSTGYDFTGKSIDFWSNQDNFEGSFYEYALEKASGIEINYFKESDLATLLTEKVTPSLWFSTAGTTFQNYGRLGAFVNLYDYLDQMPNLKAHMEDPANAVLFGAQMVSEDEMYSAPVIQGGDIQRYCFLYREDIMEELDIEYWHDWDSFYAALKKMKEAYPDSYPLTLRSMSGAAAQLIEMGLMWGERHQQIGHSNTVLKLDEETGTYYSPYKSDAYRQMLSDLALLMEEGLLHPSCMTFGSSEWIASIGSGTSFVTYDKGWQWDSMMKALSETDPDARMVAGAPIVMREGGIAASTSPTTGYTWGVSARCADLELALQFLDWMYSEEAKMACSWGVLGESYDLDENGNPYFTLNENFTEDDKKIFGRYQLALYLDFESTLSTYSEECAEIVKFALQYGTEPFDPKLTLDQQASSVSDVYANVYNDIAWANIQEFLTLEKDVNNDADWQAHCDELTAANEAELKAEYERLYAEGAWVYTN